MKNSKIYNDILKSWEVPFEKSTERAWTELEPRLNSSGKPVSGTFRIYRRAIAYTAAAAAIVLGILILWPESAMREVYVMETTTLALPDNSMMTLNAHSSAKFHEDWSGDRVIELDGQAFFEVQKGKKFTVKTAWGTVEVLGTSFDVFARKEGLRVECQTGKVQVISGKSGTVITSGQAAELENNQLVINNFDVSKPDWRSGEFYFVNEPVENVFTEIERQFNVRITIPELNERNFTGRFTNKNLTEALETVCLSMNLKFTVKSPQEIIISNS